MAAETDSASLGVVIGRLTLADMQRVLPRRMPGWLRILVVAGLLLALLPSAAAAQSAGDDQYSDPFGDKEPVQATPAPTAAPAPAAQPAPGDARTGRAGAARAGRRAAAAAAPTGADPWLPALLGLTLLSAGVALRARARREP